VPELGVEHQVEEELEAISWQAEGVSEGDSSAVVQLVGQQPSRACFCDGTCSAPNGCPRGLMESDGGGLALELMPGLIAALETVINQAFLMTLPGEHPGPAYRHSSRFPAQVDPLD
jgi:hypothetical protein